MVVQAWRAPRSSATGPAASSIVTARSSATCSWASPTMMGARVVRPPHPRQGRHGDDRAPPRAQHALQLGHSACVIGDVLEDVERGHQVERGVGERQLGGRAGDRRQSAPRADLTRPLAGIEAHDIRIVKRVPERRQIGPGAATDVEHANLGREPLSAQHRHNDLAARAKPPVRPLDAAHLLEEVRVHDAPAARGHRAGSCRGSGSRRRRRSR